MTLIAAFFCFCMFCYAGFLLRNAWFFSRSLPNPSHKSRSNTVYPFVSVIIPARNEEQHIFACLHAVLQQDYPKEKFEILLIDDHSTDRTHSIAASLAASHSQLRIIRLDRKGQNSYKKIAIQEGIAASQGELILQTDGDCMVPKSWISTMVAQFTPSVGMVTGPVALSYSDHWFERFQALEYLGLIAIGAGSLAAGSPNMCNGANLAYRKSAFKAVDGYQGVDHFASGDDEMLMHKIFAHPEYEVTFAKSRAAIVKTPALGKWHAFKSQRIRWVSKARHYQNKGINLAQMNAYLAFLGIPVLAVFSIIDAAILPFLLLAIILKFLSEGIILFLSATFFQKLSLFTYALFYQPIYLTYVLWVGVAGSFASSYSWKGRNVV